MTREGIKAYLGLGRVLCGWVRDMGIDVNIKDCACILPFLLRVCERSICALE